MRKRSALPTPPNCFGNMLRLAMARFEPDESKTGLRDLVITRCNELAMSCSREQQRVLEDGMRRQERPAWVSSPHKPVPVVNLLDTKDGGVAVWMTAEEMDMILFQRDPEIVDLTSTSQLKNHV
ncbi:hypothetical protein OIU78_025650 [Salix suchowensis]|nr:hypothetical protein OIU78_025650 [Salix suchowensis]